LVEPNIENMDDLLSSLTLSDQAVLRKMSVYIENGGDMNIDPQTLWEVEEFKRLEMNYSENKAFAFIPK
jgi:hypothetical protein